MKRRTFLQGGLSMAMARPLMATLRQGELDAASNAMARAAAEGTVHAAALHVDYPGTTLSKSFGASKSADDLFLLASISKPISVAALMTLYDQRRFKLHDPVTRFIPEFTGDGREGITVQQLLTHVNGLPDQLPENAALRRAHADLSEFVDHAIRTPLLFKPGTKYSYSSMGILLASEIAQRITGVPFPEFVDETVFQKLDMKRSAMGLGDFNVDETMRCQVEDAAPESGAGDPSAKAWDWNSVYWRSLGAPWGGAHGSASDVAKFLHEFLHAEGSVVRPETANLMLRNHNPKALTPRGLGFAIGTRAGSPGCSEKTFGHDGSTGTLAWADPATKTICVVLTTLPARAANPHPRNIVSDLVAKSVGQA